MGVPLLSRNDKCATAMLTCETKASYEVITVLKKVFYDLLKTLKRYLLVWTGFARSNAFSATSISTNEKLLQKSQKILKKTTEVAERLIVKNC